MISSKLDLEGSYSSDKHRQTKLEKLEQEISRLLERNDGKLFIVKHEKNGPHKEEGKSEDYSDEESSMGVYGHLAYNSYRKEKPIFKIKYKPRKSCMLHTKLKEEEPDHTCEHPKSTRGRKPKHANEL